MARVMKKWGVAGIAVAFLVGVTGCGNDDDTGSGTTVARDEVEQTMPVDDRGDGDEQGAPDVNPCAPGESGTLGPPGDDPADDATAVTINGSEYEFTGQEALSAAGEYAITFTNTGNELHEFVLMRIDDDETRPLSELLMEESAEEFTTEVAFAFACPGDSSEPVAADLTEPGRYVAVCFIPVGTLPSTSPEDFEGMGPPHAMQGMVAEIQVD
jgi:hypothetical protein